MEERIGLVFSWDPRAQHWVKERGPEDAPPPPADPIDNEAVQTYFLDSHRAGADGTAHGAHLGVTDVWRKGAEGWRIVYAHESVVPR